MARDPLADPAPLIRRVYAYVAYRIGDGAEAEDITSETFERALRYRASYDARKGTPATWLLGIATRCIADAATRRAGEVLVSEPPERPGGDEAAATSTRLDLADAVSQLSERDRELVALRYGADLRAREIAGLLGMKTGAVEVALHRALERLKTELEAPPVTPPPGVGELTP